MSKRKILTPDKVGDTADKVSQSLYEKLIEIKKPENHALIVSLFKDLDTRRKCYKLGQFGFNVHATEYFFPKFYSPITFAGRTRLIPVEEAKQIKFVKALTALMQLLGYASKYDSTLDLLETVSESDLSENRLVEIIPEMLYAYSGPKNDTLYLKLEYYFGAEVIDILDINNIDINTGKPRIYKERAKEHAKLYLTGKTVTQHRAETKAQEAETQEAD